jgi:hypothetical protein
MCLKGTLNMQLNWPKENEGHVQAKALLLGYVLYHKRDRGIRASGLAPALIGQRACTFLPPL